MSYLRDKRFRIGRFVQVGTKRKPRWQWQFFVGIRDHQWAWTPTARLAKVVEYEEMQACLVALRCSATKFRIDVMPGGNRGIGPICPVAQQRPDE